MLLLSKARSGNVSYNHFNAGCRIRHDVQIVGQICVGREQACTQMRGEATKRGLENVTIGVQSHFPEKILLV